MATMYHFMSKETQVLHLSNMLEERSVKKKVFFSYAQYIFHQKAKFLDIPH